MPANIGTPANGVSTVRPYRRAPKLPTENFCIFAGRFLNARPMTKPLALIFYERLMPGSQLVNRLQDLGYRVSTCTELAGLHAQVENELPMILVMDLNSERGDVNGVIKDIRN